MLSVLIASSKGGSGKSTISTQLAAYFALAGKHTVLVDADPQGSSTRWCEKRALQRAPVCPVDGCRRGWEKRVPAETQRLLVDAPAGALGQSLDAYVEFVDAILVPVAPSMIDLEATLPFLASMTALEKVRRGRRPLALVGNRMRPWTSSSQHALEQIQTWTYPLAASLRDSQAYALLTGLGKSLFDYHSESVRAHQRDWDGVFQWLRGVNKNK